MYLRYKKPSFYLTTESQSYQHLKQVIRQSDGPAIKGVCGPATGGVARVFAVRVQLPGLYECRGTHLISD